MAALGFSNADLVHQHTWPQGELIGSCQVITHEEQLRPGSFHLGDVSFGSNKRGGPLVQYRTSFIVDPTGIPGRVKAASQAIVQQFRAAA